MTPDDDGMCVTCGECPQGEFASGNCNWCEREAQAWDRETARAESEAEEAGGWPRIRTTKE